MTAVDEEMTALISVGLALDEYERLGVGVITDAAFRVRVSVTDLRAIFNAAALVAGDLHDLPVSEPIRFALWRGGIGTVAQLRTRTREQLLGIRNLGPARVNEIERALWCPAEPSS